MKRIITSLVVLMSVCGSGYSMYSKAECSEKESPYTIDQNKLNKLRKQKVCKVRGRRITRPSSYYKRKELQNKEQYFITNQDGNQIDLSTGKKRVLYCFFTAIDLLGEYTQQ